MNWNREAFSSVAMRPITRSRSNDAAFTDDRNRIRLNPLVERDDARHKLARCKHREAGEHGGVPRRVDAGGLDGTVI